MADYLLQTDNTSKILLTDGTSMLLLQGAPPPPVPNQHDPHRVTPILAQ